MGWGTRVECTRSITAGPPSYSGLVGEETGFGPDLSEVLGTLFGLHVSTSQDVATQIGDCPD